MLKYNTCAHARPRLHPFTPVDFKDHDPVYPVAPCCKKAVSYKVAEPRSYISAIPDSLVPYLAGAVQESKNAWKQASADYVDGWRKVDNPKSRHPAVVEILKNNNRLTRKVKAAKAQHERWAKIRSIWAEISAC